MQDKNLIYHKMPIANLISDFITAENKKFFIEFNNSIIAPIDEITITNEICFHNYEIDENVNYDFTDNDKIEYYTRAEQTDK